MHNSAHSSRPAQAVVEPSASSPVQQTLTLTLLATTPAATRCDVAVTSPPGWSVSTPSTNVNVASYGLPTQVELPLKITAPAGTAPGTYQFSITATMPGAAPLQKQATISVQSPVHCAIETKTSCAVDLSGVYNEDGVATQADPSQGNFDGHGNSFAADLLPPARRRPPLAGSPSRRPRRRAPPSTSSRRTARPSSCPPAATAASRSSAPPATAARAATASPPSSPTRTAAPPHCRSSSPAGTAASLTSATPWPSACHTGSAPAERAPSRYPCTKPPCRSIHTSRSAPSHFHFARCPSGSIPD